MQIIPSILVQSEQEFLEKLNGLDNAADLVQLDIADGKFVPNTTWADPEVIKNLDQNVELHLMVENPEQEIKHWVGIKNVKNIIIHIETIAENFKFQISNFKLSLALNPQTPLSSLEPYINQISGVLFMSVHPGVQGNPFIPEVLEKIKEFKQKHPNIFTEIDGAVNEETLPKIIESGVDAVCPGSAIVGSGNPKENYLRMQELINRLTRNKIQDTISK